METVFIEALSEEGNHGKFMLGRFDDEEWGRRSEVDDLLPSHQPSVQLVARGWTDSHLLVLDLQTGEGAVFRIGGFAAADLEKHSIWVCPLFEPFLEWLYQQDVTDLSALPKVVPITGVGLQLAGHRRPGPFEQVPDAFYAPASGDVYRMPPGAGPFSQADQAVFRRPGGS